MPKVTIQVFKIVKFSKDEGQKRCIEDLNKIEMKEFTSEISLKG